MTLIISGIKYLFVFSIVLFLFKVSEIKYEKSTKITSGGFLTYKISRNLFDATMISLLAITILSLFAGLRANDVGVDTSGYPVKFMSVASTCASYTDVINSIPELGNEPLGALLVYICSRITSDPWLLLFFYQFLALIPLHKAFVLFKDEIKITDAYAIYLFMFFNNSLNMMRQSVGCAFILYALAQIIKDKRITFKLLISLSCAFLFHRSSIYGIALVFGAYFAFNISKKVVKCLIFLVVIIFPAVMNTAATFIAGITRDEHVLYYLDVFINGKANRDWFINPFSTYSIVYMLVCMGIFGLLYVFTSKCFGRRNKLKEVFISKQEFDKLVFLNFIGMIMYFAILFSLKTMYGMRFSIFFDYIYMLSIPIVIKSDRNRQILYLFLFVSWALWIMRMGWSGSELYSFRF